VLGISKANIYLKYWRSNVISSYSKLLAYDGIMLGTTYRMWNTKYKSFILMMFYIQVLEKQFGFLKRH